MTGIYRATQLTARFLGRMIWRVRAYGVENIPKSGPFIIASNHLSFFDPPMLGLFCPRQIMYMAKAELFRVPILGPAIRLLGAFPVERSASPAAAIKHSLELLQAGRVVGLFPEGTRNKRGDARPQLGAALLASLTGTPIVPARLVGTDRVGKLQRVFVYYGAPIRFAQNGKATREDLAKFTEQIMEAIHSLGTQHSKTQD